MATINRSYVSDAAQSGVRVELGKDGAGEFYAIISVSFDGGKRNVSKRVLFSELNPAQEGSGIAFYNALHALALAKVAADDF